MDEFISRLLVSCFFLAPACIPLDGAPVTDSDVAGTIGGRDFQVSSGSAELNVDSAYVITLADTPEFSCTATGGLPADYLQVVIGEVSEPTTYDADGRVYFNVFEGGVSTPEAANSGTVTIDAIDAFSGFIDGSIDASGGSSSVSGSFSVEICP